MMFSPTIVSILFTLAVILFIYLVYIKVIAREGNERLKFILLIVLGFVFFYGSMWLVILNP